MEILMQVYLLKIYAVKEKYYWNYILIINSQVNSMIDKLN